MTQDDEDGDVGPGVVGFGDDDDDEAEDGVAQRQSGKPLTGRRAKREKELKKKMRTGTFESLGLSGPVLRAIKRKGYRLPTPIQRRTLPLILQGADIIGMARTGSGKTAAFVIPMIERLKAHSMKAGARAVLLAPTRELALQTHKAVREMAKFTDLRTAVLVGGDALEAQFAELANNPDIIVATPGRLLHHLAEVEGMGLRSVEFCVLDEADRLFEMGFAEQVREILGKMSDRRQTLLFSATLPSSLAEFASAGLTAPQLIRLDSERRISPDLKLAFFTVRQDDKLSALMYLVREALAAEQQTLIFAATRHHVEYLSNLMANDGIPAACVYGSMDQTARKIHVAKFRVKKVSLLITTDVAARGIDIPLIDNVINLDFPAKPELFIHRVGRAARMGRPGTAYSLLTRDELPYLLDLHLYLGRTVQPAPLDLSTAQALADQFAADGQSGSMFGSMPDALLSTQVERLRELNATHTDLSSMERTLSNAFSLYLRTRPPASPESVKRAKGMAKEGHHPHLLAALPATRYTDQSSEAALAQFTAALRSFRPAATVLEAEIAAVKSSHTSVPLLQSHGAKSKSHDVMQRKRLAHAAVIDAERQKRARSQAAGDADAAARHGMASAGLRDAAGGRGGLLAADDEQMEDDDPAPDAARSTSHARAAAKLTAEFGDGVLNEGKYRDSTLYISHVRDPNRPVEQTFQLDRAAAELQAAVMDMTAEDQEGMAAQQRRWHWDKRKKKYVRVTGSEATAGQAGRRVKNESGKTASKTSDSKNKGIYQKWMRTQHKRVAATGSLEDPGGAALAQKLADRFKPGNRFASWKGPSPGAPAAGPGRAGKDELKTRDQVRVEREKKERRKEWLQQKQESGGKQRSGGGKPSRANSSSSSGPGSRGKGKGGKAGSAAPGGKRPAGSAHGKARQRKQSMAVAVCLSNSLETTRYQIGLLLGC